MGLFLLFCSSSFISNYIVLKQMLKFIFLLTVNAADYRNSLSTQNQRGQEKPDLR